METAVQVMQKIRSHGEQVADDSLRSVGALAEGDHTAQGDVMFWFLDNLPKDCIKTINPERQLAPGTTLGSRHCVCISDMHKIEFYNLKNPNALQGSILKCRDSVTIEHPEHGNQKLREGIWFVTYQRAYADELRRIED